ncbi:hypothetical protein [Natrialba sp. PRR66]|uniref:hypothetical protein n=1 Tax=Natrialba sp. PRR66 TaxID=3098146 RepID=UPI002B1CF843|nr:hypothetical protein [Natrialba sp. PRR66]
METISTILQAVTGFLTMVLTGLLVYFYKEMKDSQAEQTEIIRKQAKIQNQQSEIQNLQTELMRGQNRPFINVLTHDIQGDTVSITISNKGNGVIKKVGLRFRIYVKCSAVDGSSDSLSSSDWREEDTVSNYNNQEKYIELGNIESDQIQKNSDHSLIRPERNTNEYISLHPNEEREGYICPKYSLWVKGEYGEYYTSQIMEVLSDLGLEHVDFHWDFVYEDLSGIKYYDHFKSSEVNLDSGDNLERIIESTNRSGILLDEVTTVNYYEKPP